MRQFARITSFAFTMISCIGFPTYLGYRFNHLVLGIVFGFIFALMYLFKFAIGKDI